MALTALPVIAFFRTPDTTGWRIATSGFCAFIIVLMVSGVFWRGVRRFVFTPQDLRVHKWNGREEVVRWIDITDVVGLMRPVKSVQSPFEIHVTDGRVIKLDARTLTADDNSLFSTLRYLGRHAGNAAELVEPELLSVLLTPPPRDQRRGLERHETIPRVTEK